MVFTYRCYVCCTDLQSIKSLFLHFRFKHNSLAVYECAQFECRRRFQYLKSFKRHLLTHLNCHQEQCVVVNNTFLSQNGSDIDCDEFENVLQEHSETHLQNTNCVQPAQSKNVDVQPENACSTNQSISLEQCGISQFTKQLPAETIIDNSSEVVDVCLKVLQDSATGFALSLYSNPNLNRATATDILLDVTNNITKVIESTLQLCISNIPNDSSAIKTVINGCSSSFSNVNTEKKLLRHFESTQYYIKPKQYVINSSVRPCVQYSSNAMQTKTATGTSVSLRAMFKSFFEIPGIFDATLTNMQDLESQTEGILTNFINGTLWKSKISKRSGIFIPFFLYFDDFETGNALGSHAGKQSIAATYVSFPTVPSEYTPLLENILVATLFNTSMKEFGKDSLFYSLVREIKDLDINGVEMVVENEKHTVYFILGLIIGDNLGLNYLLGFSQSFSSNYYCRFCKSHKSLLCKQTVQTTDDILRNRDNYSADLLLNDSTKTGVYAEGDSIFNTIPSYHVTENMAVDIMHDLLEGVCHYDICNMLLHFVDNSRLFSLSSLNNRLFSFDFSGLELKDKPVTEITYNHLKNKKLKMSASEMFCFVCILPYLIGDYIPEDDSIWSMFLNLLTIIDVLMMPHIDFATIKYLKYLIQEHHEQYLHNFSDSLKPKHHFMVHYPQIIQCVGPLKHIWCMRYEAKHKQLKLTAHNTASKRNLPLTLLIKQQLIFAQRLYLKQGFINRIVCGGPDSKALPTEFSLLTVNDLSIENCRIKWVKNCGTKFKPGFIVSIVKEDDIIFYKIMYILKFDTGIFLFCKPLTYIGFNQHLQAHNILCKSISNTQYKCIDLDDITSFPTSCHVTSNGEMYCRLKN